jgi:hypothetical protein
LFTHTMRKNCIIKKYSHESNGSIDKNLTTQNRKK